MKNVVEVVGLTKQYGKVNAVDNVSFSLEDGKIYGLLGRNGAGKTTIMHILTAQLFKTSGQVKVFGEDPYENERVLKQICFIKESQKYPEMFCVKDVMSVSPMFFPNWDREFASELIEVFNLPLNRRIRKLSRGMLSAVGIIVGLASRAPLTIFDEPYLGLDAVARDLFYNKLLEDYAEHPRTIVLSTHLIDEVSQLLEHVLVIDQGRMVLNEESEALRGRASNIIGSAAKVEFFLAGKQVIHREPLGGLLSATLLGALTAEDRDQASELGLEIAPVSLQQMIVHMTGSKRGNKEEAQ